MPEGTTKEQVPEMLRTLLAERFKLTIHRETKDHAVYALVVARRPENEGSRAAAGCCRTGIHGRRTGAPAEHGQ